MTTNTINMDITNNTNMREENGSDIATKKTSTQHKANNVESVISVPSNPEGTSTASPEDQSEETIGSTGNTLSVVNGSKAIMVITMNVSQEQGKETIGNEMSGSNESKNDELERDTNWKELENDGKDYSEAPAEDDDNNKRASFSTIKPPLRLVSIRPDLVGNTTLDSKGVISSNTSSGNTSDTATTTFVQQNDGPDKPRCTSKKCAVRKTLDTPSVLPTYPDDDEDEGIRNLRRILKEAQAAIKRFQLDLEQESSGKNPNHDSASQWTLPGGTEITSNAMDDDKQTDGDMEDCADEGLKSVDTDIGKGENTDEEKNEGEKTEEESTEDKKTLEESVEYTDKNERELNGTEDIVEEKTEGGHRRRHHHGQQGTRRHHDTFKESVEAGSIQESTPIPIPLPSHTFTEIPPITASHSQNSPLSSRYPVRSSSPNYHSFSSSIQLSSSSVSPTVSPTFSSYPISHASSSPSASHSSSLRESSSSSSSKFPSPSSHRVSHSSTQTTSPFLRLWHTWEAQLETTTKKNMQNKMKLPEEIVF